VQVEAAESGTLEPTVNVELGTFSVATSQTRPRSWLAELTASQTEFVLPWRRAYALIE